LIVWTWRDLLNLTSVAGILSGPPVQQKSAEEISAKTEPAGAKSREVEVDTTELDVEKARQDDLKNHILSMLREKHAVNRSIVVEEFSITRQQAELLLFRLYKEGRLRRDGFPRRTVYTLADSLENRAIDFARAEIEKEDRILSERRFVRIKSLHEADAILSSKDRTYVVEVKLIRDVAREEVLDRGVRQLCRIAEEFRPRPLIGYLVLVVHRSEQLSRIEKLVSRLTFDDKNVEIRVLTVLAERLSAIPSGT